MSQQPQPGAHARLAVSTVIFALSPDAGTHLPSLRIPLVRRLREPGLGHWALPGGWLPAREDLDAAAARTLGETTGLAPKYLEQLYTFGGRRSLPRRARRLGRLLGARPLRRGRAGRLRRERLLVRRRRTARSRVRPPPIIDYALWRLRTKLAYSRIAHAFLGETFTMAELRGVHEAVLRTHLDPANFRRTIEASGTLVDTGERLAGTPHRPPALYRFDTERRHRPDPPHTRMTKMTIAPPPARDAGATRTAAVTRAAASVDRTIRLITAGSATGETCAPELAQGPWEFDRGPGGLRSRLVDGRRHPHRLTAPGRPPRVVPHRVERRAARRASAPPRRPSATGSSCSATSTSATRSSRTPTSSGDSFQLANAAKSRPDAEAIVFCGVHFMAETADLLSTPEQAVILPNLAAGCSMADMADESSVEECWEQLEDVYGDLAATDADGRVPGDPRHLHELVGRAQGLRRPPRRHRLHLLQRARRCSSGRSSGGSACSSSPTSTSAATPPRPWACRSNRCRCGTRARRSGATRPQSSMRRGSSCGTGSARCTSASRSTRSPPHAQTHPGVQVIVHPECPMPVVDAADAAGSTDFIVKAIQAAPDGSTFAIGTEINLVQRLAAEYPQHDDLLPRPGGVPLLDDVPHPPRLPRLGARRARRRAHRQPHHGRRRGRRPRAGRPRADARGEAARRCADPGRRSLTWCTCSSSAAASPGSGRP